jgi:hypothetical protein
MGALVIHPTLGAAKLKLPWRLGARIDAFLPNDSELKLVNYLWITLSERVCREN